MMKTPFDSALRIQRRAMDEFRIGLRNENEILTSVASARANVESRLTREAAVAATDVSVVSYAFADKLRAQRRGLIVEQNQSWLRLERLRDRALQASGELRAIEVAADDFGGTELRRLDRLEQAEADDLAGSRLAGIAVPRRLARSVYA